jgi:hypothetical protein
MIQLPPGCRLNYNIWIDVDALTDNMCEWFEMIGGSVTEKAEAFSGRSYSLKVVKQVQYGRAKPSYHRQDGTGCVKINFSGDDASTASMFLLKFMDNIKAHNMKEYDNVSVF